MNRDYSVGLTDILSLKKGGLTDLFFLMIMEDLYISEF